MYGSPYSKIEYYYKSIYPEPLNREELPSTEKIMVRAYLTDICLGESVTIDKFNENFKDIEEYAKEENVTNLTIREHEYRDGNMYCESELNTYYSVVVMCERIETDEELAARMEYNKEKAERKKDHEAKERKKYEALKKKYEEGA